MALPGYFEGKQDRLASLAEKEWQLGSLTKTQVNIKNKTLWYTCAFCLSTVQNLNKDRSMELIMIFKQIWIPVEVIFESINNVPVPGLWLSPMLSCLPSLTIPWVKNHYCLRKLRFRDIKYLAQQHTDKNGKAASQLSSLEEQFRIPSSKLWWPRLESLIFFYNYKIGSVLNNYGIIGRKMPPPKVGIGRILTWEFTSDSS